MAFFFGMIYLTNPNGRARLPPSRNPVFLRANGSAGASPSRARELGFVKYIVPFFFATGDDLLPVLSNVEAKRAVVYTPFGHIPGPTAERFRTARDLPTLFQPQPFESSIGGPAYVVTEAGTGVVLRQLSRHEGKDRWAVDQLANPDSTVLRHGGLFKDNRPGAAGIETRVRFWGGLAACRAGFS